MRVAPRPRKLLDKSKEMVSCWEEGFNSIPFNVVLIGCLSELICSMCKIGF